MFITVTAFVSCSDNSEETPPEVSILGTWEFYSVTDTSGVQTLQSSLTECLDTVTFLESDKGKEKNYTSTQKPCSSFSIKDFDYTVNNETLSVTYGNNSTVTLTILELTATKLLLKNKNGRKVELRRL